MKLTKEEKTLFAALCEQFVDKAGHNLKRRSYGEATTLVATRNDEGQIKNIDLVFRQKDQPEMVILTIDSINNAVLVDTAQQFHRNLMNRLNKVLSLVDLNLRSQEGHWVIEDKMGQMAQFRNGEVINLARPHGSAIYPETQANEPTPAQ